ncbi:transporter, major facilitator family protein [Aeromicrobium marinum DSM 15272]|uniref:Transporter, major facilitator family protein n=1 Tax=Aeromicrobium marinum DSM 15272 TaxID=585531 RepID=E2S8D1_9ACTN|nr:transporter, major facilitator family protein [Aeromicrobium marinum DSM 15272]
MVEFPREDWPVTTRRTHPGVVFAVLAASVMSFSLLQSMSVPTLPLVQEQFGASQAQASWIVTAQLLAASIATPIIGRLGDAYGKNRMLVFAVAALAVGALVAAVAPTIEVMIAARVIQGIGGGVIPLAFGIIRDEMPEHRRSSAISVTSSLLAVGFGVGIVVAGPLIDLIGLHWLFVPPAVVAGGAALAAALVIPTSPVRATGGVSIAPAVLLAGWLSCLLLAVSQGPTWGWTSPAVLGFAVAGVVVLLGWVRAENTARAPVIDLRMMRLKAVWTTHLVALLVGFSMYASFGFTPQLLQTPTASGYGLGLTVTQAGLVMLPAAAATFVMGLVATPLSRRIDPRLLVVAACGISSTGMALTATWHDAAWHVAVGVGITSVGIGLVFALLANLIVAAVPAEQTGVATGMNANLRTMGGAVGAAVATSIVTATVQPSGFATETGYVVTFAVLSAVMLLAALAGLLVPAGPQSRRGRSLAAAGAPRPSVLTAR